MKADWHTAHPSYADRPILPLINGGRLAGMMAPRKWVWSVVCLFNLILIGLAGLALQLSRAQYQERAFVAAATLAQVVEQNLITTFEKIDSGLLTTSDEFDRELQSGAIDDQALDKFLARIDSRVPESLGLRISNPEGIITHAVSGVVAVGANTANRGYFISLRDNPRSGLVLDGPFMGISSQKPIIILARRLNFPNGEFAGDVHSAIPLAYLNQAIAPIDVGSRAVVTVLSGKLAVLARKPSVTGAEAILAQTAPSAAFRQVIESGRHEARFESRSGIDNIQRTTFFRRVGSYPLMVNVGVSSDDYLAPWWREADWVSGLILFFMLGTFATGWMIEQRWKERAEAVALLARQEKKFRTAFETNIDAAVIARVDNKRIVEVNQAFSDITGFQRDDILQLTTEDIEIWVEPADRQTLIDTVRERSFIRNMETRIRTKSGKLLWALVSAWLIELDGVACILSVARDISALKSAQDEIRTLAYYDPLTNLPNRRLLLEQMGRDVIGDRAKRALLFIDLDNFKTLNDTLGHEAGDLLLQEIARRLMFCVRESDMVGRLGGDEFVVLLANLSDDASVASRQAERVGEKIRAAISQPFIIGKQEVQITSSVGATFFSNIENSIGEIFTQADIAMYQAKAAGRNTMRFFSPELQEKLVARALLEEELRAAVKNGQFILHYQPQIDFGRIVGAEALIRWQHPTRGIITPGEFILVAEETGLILPIGHWVLETACRQIAAWSDRPETASIVLAINVSARQFRQPGFVDQVLDVLDREGADPKNLKLEITESMLLENIEEIIEKMTALKTRGVGLSLDDFGTGYSSLSYLKRLPLDQLKIDQSFVRDLNKDPNDDVIIETIIVLAQAMGLSVIAEGVETKEQQEFLSSRGCNALQGYLFGRPMTNDMFERLLMASPEQAG